MNKLTHFTLNTRQALSTAQREALLEQSSTIDSHHLLIALTQLPVAESTAAHILNGFNITADKLRRTPGNNRIQSTQPDLSTEAKKVLERATATALERGETGITSAHLLAGLLADENIPLALAGVGTSVERVSQALHSLDDWTEAS
jgi:ATP-dependent Clp protease ATP-binding subunit ClpA